LPDRYTHIYVQKYNNSLKQAAESFFPVDYANLLDVTRDATPRKVTVEQAM